MCFVCNWLKKLFNCCNDDDVIYYDPASSTPVSPYQQSYEEDVLDDIDEISLNRKRALLVGINKYIISEDYNLQGCVNDVNAMKSLLINHFGFDENNIKIIIDEKATKENIIEGIEWLMDEAIAGDELVFHYSGHGSQVLDIDKDETIDNLDEIICPTDMNWDDPLNDDILYSYFKGLSPGAFLTCIIDSCHSGTVTRKIKKNIINKYLPPPYNISTLKSLKIKKFAVSNGKDVQNHILLSGCKDDQTSADSCINDIWRGAMTWALIKSIEELEYDASWNSVYENLIKIIKDENFEQEPQLSGSDSLKERFIFGGR